MSAVTQWFGPDHKPVRPGIYELEGLSGPYLFWSIEQQAWLGALMSPDDFTGTRWMVTHPFGTGYPATCRWRGLAKEPK